MIDWLRRNDPDPVIELCGRSLPIVIKRHPRARRMTLRLAPDGAEVRMTLPSWGQTRDAMAFAQARRDWLEQQLARMPQRLPPEAGGTLAYRGNELPIAWEAKAPRRPTIDGEVIRIGGPDGSITRRLQRWLEGEALALMDRDLSHYCAAATQEVPKLRLSRAQRRWGSCAGDGTIRINWRLVQAPDFVRRSVVAHEVAHLTHFDHSPAFHALLGDIYEHEIETANRWLKEQGRSLYTAFG